MVGRRPEAEIMHPIFVLFPVAVLAGAVPRAAGPSRLAASTPAAVVAPRTQDPAWLPNRGQWPAEVRAAMRHGAMTSWLTESGWVTRAVDVVGTPPPRPDLGPTAALPVRHEAVVTVTLPGAGGRLGFGDELPGTMAFFVDGDARRWASAVPRHAVAVWRDAWPGIDFEFTLRGGALCYDLRVAPGADLTAVQLQLAGMESVAIDGEGGLALATSCGTLRHGAPVAWQNDATGCRVPVGVRFVARGRETFGFQVEGHDPARALVIDPPLQWLVMHGGTGGEGLASIRCLDRNAAGELALCGSTSSFNFPTPAPTPTSGGLDGFVSVFSANGVLLWGAVVGGSRGMDFHRACAWDAQGGVVFAGSSSSGPTGPYPTTPGALQPSCSGPYGHQATGDIILGRLVGGPGAVTLAWATYLGGTGHEQANGITCTPGGRVAIAGWTNSATMPANGYQPQLAGSFDSYLAVLDPAALGAAQFVAGTYLGGGAVDFAGGIVVDAVGRLCIGGASDSLAPTPHPTANPLQATQGGGTDGIVAVLDAALTTLVYGTYLGGAGADGAGEIAVDAQGQLVVGDWTAGFPFPMPPGAYQPTVTTAWNGYVLRLAWSLPPAQQLVWGTYFGGTMRTGINGLAVDAADRVTVVGAVSGMPPNQPLGTTPWALQPIFVGGPGGPTGHWDAFVSRFDPQRVGADQLVYSTFLGDAGFDYGYDVVLDERARPIVAGPTGSTSLFGRVGYGGGDVFLAHLDLLASVSERDGAPSPQCSDAFADAYHRLLPGGLDLTLTVSHAAPAALALLAFGAPNPAGTPLVLPPTLMVHVALTSPIVLLGPFPVDAQGRTEHRFVVPANLPPYGVSAQWLLLGGCSPWSASDAIRL